MTHFICIEVRLKSVDFYAEMVVKKPVELELRADGTWLSSPPG